MEDVPLWSPPTNDAFAAAAAAAAADDDDDDSVFGGVDDSFFGGVDESVFRGVEDEVLHPPPPPDGVDDDVGDSDGPFDEYRDDRTRPRDRRTAAAPPPPGDDDAALSAAEHGDDGIVEIGDESEDCPDGGGGKSPTNEAVGYGGGGGGRRRRRRRPGEKSSTTVADGFGWAPKSDGVDVGKRRGDPPPSYSSSKSSSSSASSYYTKRPEPSAHLKSEILSYSQRLREYRHSRGLMTCMSTIVLLAVLLSSAVTMTLYALPQFVIGIFLGPILMNKFWMIEFLYRYNVARWGHMKIFAYALRRNEKQAEGLGGKKKKKKKEEKEEEGSKSKKEERSTKSGAGGGGGGGGGGGRWTDTRGRRIAVSSSCRDGCTCTRYQTS